LSFFRVTFADEGRFIWIEADPTLFGPSPNGKPLPPPMTPDADAPPPSPPPSGAPRLTPLSPPTTPPPSSSGAKP
jgi:hypothetical protein